MTERMPTRQEALDLLFRFNQSNSLRKHAYAFEGAMRYIARKLWPWCQVYTLERPSGVRYFSPMSRPLRIEYPNAYYHITSRGNERKAIFNSKWDYERLLGYFESVTER